jgi:hypothetical protein
VGGGEVDSPIYSTDTWGVGLQVTKR